MNDANDEKLVLRAQEGSPQAFDDLLRLHERALFRHARRMLCSEDEAYDALQQAFLVIVRKIRDLRQREHFRAWAFGVTTRVCLKHLSRRSTRNIAFEQAEEPVADAALSPEALAATSQRREALLENVLRLSPAVRSVLLLHFYEGLSLGEVAAALEIRPGTVKSRLSAGLQSLRTNEEVADV